MSEAEGLGQPFSEGQTFVHGLPDTCHFDPAYTCHWWEFLPGARSVAILDNLDFLWSFPGTFHPWVFLQPHCCPSNIGKQDDRLETPLLGAKKTAQVHHLELRCCISVLPYHDLPSGKDLWLSDMLLGAGCRPELGTPSRGDLSGSWHYVYNLQPMSKLAPPAIPSPCQVTVDIGSIQTLSSITHELFQTSFPQSSA